MTATLTPPANACDAANTDREPFAGWDVRYGLHRAEWDDDNPLDFYTFVDQLIASLGDAFPGATVAVSWDYRTVGGLPGSLKPAVIDPTNTKREEFLPTVTAVADRVHDASFRQIGSGETGFSIPFEDAERRPDHIKEDAHA